MARPKTLKKAIPGITRFARFAKPKLFQEKKLIVISMCFLFAEVFFLLLEPWPLKYIIDDILFDQSAQESQHNFLLFSNLSVNVAIIAAAASLILIILFRAISGFKSIVGFALVGNRVVTKIRSELFQHIQNLPLSFHGKARSGDLIMRSISDVAMLKEVMVTAVLPMIGNFIILICMFAVMFWLNWQLAILSLVTLPLFLLITTRFGNKIHNVSRKARKREGALASTASESIGAIKTVKALSLDKTFVDAFLSQNNKSMKESVKSKRLSAYLEKGVDVIVAIATAMVLWFGAHLVINKELTPGELLVFLFYLKAAFKPLQRFAKYSARIAKASAAGERVLELFDQEQDIQDPAKPVSAANIQGNISINNVSFAYDSNSKILSNISLTLKKGEKIALVGQSGSGKSTLASLIMRLHDIEQGSILIDGHDVKNYSIDSLRSKIAVVLQDTLLFSGTIKENIALGLENISDEAIIEAAKVANAHNFITSMPLGYETPVGERGVTLSGGQRQRISIARAAIRNTPILILDEPTSGLDEENERIVFDALEKLSSGKTTILITHNLKQAASYQRIGDLENGRIIGLGTHEELMKDNTFYAKTFKSSYSMDRNAGNSHVA